MDSNWTAYARDAAREVQVVRHAVATFQEVLNETATGGVDLSDFVVRCTQSAHECQVEFGFHSELYDTGQPTVGDLLEVRLDGKQLWVGIIDAVNDYRLTRGERRLSITARSRDASPLWREVPRVTPLYPVATPLAVIARQLATQLFLSVDEQVLPDISAYTVHSNTQLANIPAWSMLTSLYQPVGYEPFVDARGRLKAISRDCTRSPDVVLTDEQILSVSASKSRSPVTSVKVKWLDPKLTKVPQQDKVLASENITAGFFQMKQEQDIFFSDDHTQRAENTRLVIKQSCNSGLLNVADEEYAVLSQTQGQITLTTEAWVHTLVIGLFIDKIAASYIPDNVYAYGWGITYPVGRTIEALDDIGILLIMASIGTGSYEVWGVAYDYVHARNTTEAYDDSRPAWLEKVVDIENDFVMDEAMAQSFAIRELIYQAKAAQSYNVTISDHPGVERGDILELPDASRLYVTSYSRSLSRGEAATLQVTGFRVS